MFAYPAARRLLGESLPACARVSLARQKHCGGIPRVTLVSLDDRLVVGSSVMARTVLLTIPELAARLRVSKRSAYRVAREMVHVVIAGRLLVPENAVDHYVAARMSAPVRQVATARARRRGRTPARADQSGVAASWLKPIEPRTKPRPH